MELKYVLPGKKLLVADHLSRSHLQKTDSSKEQKIEAYVMMIVNSLSLSDIRMIEFKNETSKDKELQEVLKYVKNGWPVNKSSVSEYTKPYFSFKEELSERNGLLLKNTCKKSISNKQKYQNQ